MIKSIFSFCVLLSAMNASSQQYEWVSEQPASVLATTQAVAKHKAGHVIVAGEFKGTADLDPGPGTFSYTTIGMQADIFVKKLDQAGNLVWALAIQSPGDERVHALATDTAGNIYMTGIFTGSVDFDPSASVNILSVSTLQNSVYIVKMDENGNFLWARQIDSDSLSNISLWDIKTDPVNGVYACGNFRDTVDFDPGPGVVLKHADTAGYEDAFVIKLDENGIFNWVNTMGGPGQDICFTLAVDDSGYVYADGSFMDTVDFDPGAAVQDLVGSTVPGGSRFLQKFDTAGNLLWARTSFYTGLGTGEMCMAIDHAGDVYLTGTFDTLSDFDPGVPLYNLAPENGEAFYLQKLDHNGELLWVKQWAGKSFMDLFKISIGDMDQVYLAWQFEDTLDADPALSIIPVVATQQLDIVVERLSSTGNLEWYGSIRGMGNQLLRDLTAGESDDLFVAGYYYDVTDFEFGPGTVSFSPAGYSGFVLKTGPATSGITENMKGLEPGLYPNPTQSAFHLVLDPLTLPANVQVYNVQGVMVQQKAIFESETLFNLAAPAGMYIIKVQAPNEQFMLKLVKQ